jgi:hypothetical protein
MLLEEARYRALFLAMFMLMLMIGVKHSCLRAKPAHLVGHLPPGVECRQFFGLCGGVNNASHRARGQKGKGGQPADRQSKGEKKRLMNGILSRRINREKAI